MTTRVTSLDGKPVIHAKGEIDHDSCGEVESAVDQVLSQGATALLIDLSEVSYIDSGGLSVLFSAGRRIREKGWIGLVSPNFSVRRLLELVGVLADPAFRVFDDLDQAQAALGAGKDK